MAAACVAIAPARYCTGRRNGALIGQTATIPGVSFPTQKPATAKRKAPKRATIPARNGPSMPGRQCMAVPFDQRPDLIWFDGKLIPTADCKISVLTHGLHYASSVFEGERAYGGEIFREHRAFRAAEALGADPGFRDPLSASPRSTPPSSLCWKRTIKRKPMCGRSPGAAPSSSAFRRRTTPSISPSRPGNGRAISIRPSGSRASGSISPNIAGPIRRPRRALAKAAGLYMICTISKHRAERRGYRRRHDARLAGPRRRMHRRQHLLRQGRQDPHADRRLLPRRHHAGNRDRRWRAGTTSR